MEDWELPDYVVPGATIRVTYGKNNPNNRTIHIRQIVDDDWVVYRVWSRRKGWQYHIEYSYLFWLWHDTGKAKLVKRGQPSPIAA